MAFPRRTCLMWFWTGGVSPGCFLWKCYGDFAESSPSPKKYRPAHSYQVTPKSPWPHYLPIMWVDIYLTSLCTEIVNWSMCLSSVCISIVCSLKRRVTAQWQQKGAGEGHADAEWEVTESAEKPRSSPRQACLTCCLRGRRLEATVAPPPTCALQHPEHSWPCWVGIIIPTLQMKESRLRVLEGS